MPCGEPTNWKAPGSQEEKMLWKNISKGGLEGQK